MTNVQAPWKLIADKQYEQSIERQNQQKIIKQRLKQKYLQQLSNQIKEKKYAIQKQKKRQSFIDRSQIQRAVQHQKRNFEIQALKNQMINQKNQVLDNQNQFYQYKKKRYQKQVQQLENQIQQNVNEQAQRMIHYQKQQQAKKKVHILQILKSQIEDNAYKKQVNSQQQRQIQRQKLQQFQQIQKRLDQQRLKQLQDLKQRAKKVDYGSHRKFQLNQNKSLIQKKNEQWSIHKDMIQRQQTLKKMQQQEKMSRAMMEDYYRRQLKRQIDQRQRQKRSKSRYQIQSDKHTLQEAIKFSNSIHEQKKNIEDIKKKEHLQFLQYQSQLRKKQQIQDKGMKLKQFKLNSDIFKSPEAVVGDTYQLDPRRIKQLQSVQKTISQTPRYNTIDVNQSRKVAYFAEKGINILM